MLPLPQMSPERLEPSSPPTLLNPLGSASPGLLASPAFPGDLLQCNPPHFCACRRTDSPNLPEPQILHKLLPLFSIFRNASVSSTYPCKSVHPSHFRISNLWSPLHFPPLLHYFPLLLHYLCTTYALFLHYFNTTSALLLH